MPERVLVTPSARAWAHGRAVAERAAAFGAEVIELKADRLPSLAAGDPRQAYRAAKGTLAVVAAPPGKRRLQPIPPSADWRVDLAEGCPAHCQYCYLAGSLQGPPVTRVYANLPEILAGLGAYVGKGAVTSRSAARAGEGTTFEASCYADPLGIEHLTGSLAAAVRHFAAWGADAQLRFTTKFAAVEPLLGLDHGCLPVPEPAPASHAGAAAHLLGQARPGGADAQHEDDALEHLPIFERRSAALQAWRSFGEQGRNQSP